MEVPHGLVLLAWVWLMAALVCALAIVADELRHPQTMAVMNVVWPVTALYGGPLAVWAYFRLGRRMAKAGAAPPHAMPSHGSPQEGREAPPTPAQMAVSASHCGTGCMLADMLGESLVFAFGWRVLGVPLYADYVVTLGLAWLFGVGFQYFSIQPMRNLPPGKAILAAMKADTLSILFFQMGMYGWMAIVYFLLFPHPHLEPDSATFWFMEQIGMMAGFAAAMPVNGWLIRSGLKEKMG